MGVVVSSASRGLAPREGLELSMSKLGHTRPLMEPRHGPQAGKSRYPHSQNTDSSPGPKAHSDLASRRSQRASAKRRGP